MDRLENSRFAQARARHALRTAGLTDDGRLTRASSTRNEVFLGSHHVVRVNRQPDQRLRREALLCDYLPKENWAPQVVAYGGEFGADFLVVNRRPGGPLSRSWPDMTLQQRRSAIEQLCQALQQLHLVPTPVQLPRIESLPYLIDPRCLTPVVPLLAGVEELRSSSVDRSILDAVEDLTHSTGDALSDYDQRQLIHGDLTFENLLWDGSRVTGLLDFEWCRGAPIDMELDVLLRMCALPHAHVASDYVHRTRAEDYAPVAEWLIEFRPDLFAHPRLFDRLRLYCLAYDVYDLVAAPPVRPAQDLDPLHPLNRIRQMLGGGGYLAAFLAPLGVSV